MYSLKNIIKFIAISMIALVSSQANAQVWMQNINAYVNNITRTMSCYTLDCGHLYVGGNIGVSHLYDRSAPGVVSSVDQNGPGWSADFGYQFNPILGLELGFNQYHKSRETINGTTPITLAETEHYSVYLAATGRLPLFYKLSALGKLGIAYSYANKIFTSGPSAASGSGAPYYGLGLDYSVTKSIDMILQWSRARGNHYTGSADLWSLGVQFALV